MPVDLAYFKECECDTDLVITKPLNHECGSWMLTKGSI